MYGRLLNVPVNIVTPCVVDMKRARARDTVEDTCKDKDYHNRKREACYDLRHKCVGQIARGFSQSHSVLGQCRSTPKHTGQREAPPLGQLAASPVSERTY